MNLKSGYPSLTKIPYHLFFIVLISSTVCLYQVNNSGEQWLEDGPRYLNNAAMIHDFFLSGEFTDPVGFASKNYVQYPAHNVPYHPPGYSTLLALWFLTFGMSYFSARCFIAACLFIFLLAFWGILRQQGLSKITSFFTCILLLSFPEVVLWSRTAMSELPASACIASGTFFFLHALNTGKRKFYWLAYAFASLAFFCRISTAGVLPCWGVAFLLKKRKTRTEWLHYTAASVIYLISGIGWVKFAASYSQHEMRHLASDSILTCLNYENLMQWWHGLPQSIGWLSCILSVLTILSFRSYNAVSKPRVIFWMSWLIGNYLLVVGMNTHYEHRYFFFALPAFAGLCQIACDTLSRFFSIQRFEPILMSILCIIIFFPVTKIDNGLTGGAEVAMKLSECQKDGNVLLATHNLDSDIIFRFRSLNPLTQRQFLRGDRTLAIRLADYYRSDNPTAAQQLARSVEEAVDLMIQGRVRYLVTYKYREDQIRSYNENNFGWVHDEVLLAHEIPNSGKFKLVERLTTKRLGATNEVSIWEYTEKLPAGPSELAVPIPTAKLVLNNN